MSEEDASDSEVMMDTKQISTQSTQGHQLTSRHLRSDMGMIDSQLKALGLYEEGLSYEQKEELLAVVAASRETAEQEASMRLRAQEWQQKVIIDDVDLGAKTAKLSLSSSPPAFVDACTSTTKVESSVCSTSSENPSSQNLFESLDTEIVSNDYPVNNSSPEITEIPLSSESNDSGSQDFKGKKPVGRRGRGRRGGAPTQSTRPSASHTISSNSIEDMEVEAIDEDIIHVDSVRQKKELEKVIPEWQPCGSPDAGSITSDRFSCQEENPIVSVSSSDHTKKLLHSIDEFHAAVNKFQRNSGVYVTWGQPITVGRAYATRSTRTRGAESENSDGISSYNSPDDDSISRDVHGSYLHLRGFDKTVASSAPKGQPSSKGYKAAATSESPKPSLFPTNSVAKRNNRLSKSQSKKHATSSSISTVSPNKILPSLRNRVSLEFKTLSTDTKENLVSIPKSSVNSCVQEDCTEDTKPLRDENSQPITRTNMPKDSPPKLFTNQTNNRVYKLTQNHNTVQSNEKRRRFLRAIEDKPIMNQTNYADPGKRKSISSNIKNFSSPAKRLKSTGSA